MLSDSRLSTLDLNARPLSRNHRSPSQGDEEDKADPEKVTRLREQLRKERAVSESEEEGGPEGTSLVGATWSAHSSEGVLARGH